MNTTLLAIGLIAAVSIFHLVLFAFGLWLVRAFGASPYIVFPGLLIGDGIGLVSAFTRSHA